MTDKNTTPSGNNQTPVSKKTSAEQESQARASSKHGETQSVIVDKFKEFSEKTGVKPQLLLGVVVGLVIILLLLSLSMCGKSEEEDANEPSSGAMQNQELDLGRQDESVGSTGGGNDNNKDDKVIGSSSDSGDESDSEEADSDDAENEGPKRGSQLDDRPAFLNEDVDPNRYAPEGESAPVNEELDARAEEVLPILDTIVNDPTFNNEGFEELKAKLNEKGLTPGPNIEFAYRSGQHYEDDGAMYESRSFKPAFYATSQPGVYEATYEVAAGALPNVSANPQDEGETRNRMRGELDAMISTGVVVPLKFTIDLNAGTVEADSNMWWAM